MLLNTPMIKPTTRIWLTGSVWRLWAIAGLLILLLSGFGSNAVHASSSNNNNQNSRVVGIVLDDSGSMSGAYQRARFAAQLLMASLNDDDLILVSTLNRPQVMQAHGRDRQKLFNYLNGTRVGGGTPYPALPAMIDAIINNTSSTQDATILIINDGAFDQVPMPASINSEFLMQRGEFKGRSIQAYFVFLAANTGTDYESYITQQQIRKNLLTVFNEDINRGDVRLRTDRSMIKDMQNVIMELHGTDIAGSQSNPVARIQNNSITIQAPFSIHNLVVIVPNSGNTSGSASFEKASFAYEQQNFSRYQAKMQASEAGLKLASNVYHIKPVEALEGGKSYQLQFDQALPGDTLVLYESGLDIQLELANDQGVVIQTNDQGVFEVPAGTEAEVRARLIDRTGKKDIPIKLAALPAQPEFTLSARGQSQDMTIRGDYASTQMDFGAIGEETRIKAIARYPGFVIPRSRDLRVVVSELKQIILNFRMQPLNDCFDCSQAQQVNVTLTDSQPPINVLDIGISSDAPITHKYSVTLQQPLPAGVTLTGPNSQNQAGKTVFSGNTTTGEITIEPKQEVVFTLSYNQAYRGPKHPITVEIKPLSSGWIGTGMATLQLATAKLQVTPSIRVQPTNQCTACSSDDNRSEIGLTRHADQNYRTAANIELAIDSNDPASNPNTTAPSEFTLSLDQPLPTGVQITSGNQTILAGNQTQTEVMLSPAQSQSLALQYNAAYTGESKPREILLRVRSNNEVLEGASTHTLTLVTHAPPVNWQSAGNTQNNNMLNLAIDELDGTHGEYLELNGELFTPLAQAKLAADGNVDLELLDDGRLLVKPDGNWLCNCFLSEGPQAFSVDYLDPVSRQTATYNGSFMLTDIPFWQKCLGVFLLSAGLLLLLAKLWCYFRVVRFPRNSYLIVKDAERRRLKRRYKLHSVWHTLLSCRDERSKPRGFKLKAMGGGAMVQHSRAIRRTLYDEGHAEYVQEAFELNNNKDCRWTWNTWWVDEERNEAYVLVSNIANGIPSAESDSLFGTTSLGTTSLGAKAD